MSENRTRPTEQSVAEYVENLPDERRREESGRLIEIMQRATGSEPVLWGSSIIGFGRYRYTYDSGRSGEWALVGFAPRKGKLSIYLMDGFEGREELLEELGPHSTGKSCLYVTRLERVDEQVLERLVEASVAAMRRRYPDHD